MCGRYSQTADLEELKERFGCQIEEGKFVLRYNIAPMQEAPVVVAEGKRTLKLMQWGLVPSWAKEMDVGYGFRSAELQPFPRRPALREPRLGHNMINARAETLTEKPSFRKSFERHRCLVLADGFYEWRKVDGGKVKIPMRFVLKSREPFAFAGLWDIWKKPDDGELYSFTIITTEPNDLMKPIHNRMPVILQRKDEEMWLDSDLRNTSKLSKFLAPYRSVEMEAYEVSTLVNSPKNDVPECIAAVEART